ncbi:MAG: hypothetical protein AB7E29_02635 [Xanthobacter sp.]
MGAVIAIYLATWCGTMLVVLLWNKRQVSAAHARSEGEGRPVRISLMTLLLSSSFVAALLTAIIAYLKMRGLSAG